jgi:hypothetical protein
MTRTQQAQVLVRLRELEEALAAVQFGRDVPDDRSAAYAIGRCRVIVESALWEAGQGLEGLRYRYRFAERNAERNGPGTGG